jgi:hypothetical protein
MSQASLNISGLRTIAMPLDFMKTTDRGWVLTSIEAWVVEDGQLRKTPKTTMTGPSWICETQSVSG